MGRLAIIVVMGFGVLLALVSRNITGRLTDAIENSTGYYNDTRARNIASSATEIYLRKVKEAEAGAGTYTLSSIMGGSATVIIDTSVDLVDATKPDSLRMTVIGTYQKIKDTSVIMLAGNAGTGGITVPGGISISSGSTATLASSGKDTTDGRNYNLAGTALDNSCADVHAISYGNPKPTITHSGTWNIVGSGGAPDTEYTAAQPNYDALAIQLASIADTTITANLSAPVVYGTTANPMIACFKPPGKSSGTVSGAGIMIFDLRGSSVDMQFNGIFTWTGLVIVIGDPGGKQLKWTQSKPIIGAVLVTGTTPKFSTSNELKVRYSCAAINMAMALTALPGNYIVLDWWE